MFSNSPGFEKASSELISNVAAKREAKLLLPGDSEYDYMKWGKAEGVARGPMELSLMPNPSKITVLEEFLHGTQYRLGIIDGSSATQVSGEIHVKDFMIRHQRILGIGEEDVNILINERDAYQRLYDKQKIEGRIR